MILISADTYGQPTMSGMGVDQQELAEILNITADHFVEPVVNLAPWREALATLSEMTSIYASAGWDGEDADPISLESYAAARAALGQLFRSHMRAPDIMVDRDGEVAFEWARGGSSVILTFERNGTLSYTSLFDHQQETPGNVIFIDTIPSAVLDKIDQVFA